jgi:predicted DNA-binding protein (UPF0278 family)
MPPSLKQKFRYYMKRYKNERDLSPLYREKIMNKNPKQHAVPTIPDIAAEKRLGPALQQFSKGSGVVLKLSKEPELTVELEPLL